jgi:hypothetical protein
VTLDWHWVVQRDVVSRRLRVCEWEVVVQRKAVKQGVCLPCIEMMTTMIHQVQLRMSVYA